MGSSLPQSKELPDRVLKAIHRQEDQSERLVGWIQLAVVILFGTLYAVSPKTFSGEQTFALVPWFLAGYLLLTVARILLARRGRLSNWVLYGSVLADMGLLLVMIWAFHLQYRQPASFYLKAPTLMYVFIFIALRSLRFEVRFVIAAGIAAAIGWAGLVAYAILDAGGLDAITRDYVRYLTSNGILVGAELDKVITIATVTAILGVAIARARRLMVKAVVGVSATRDLSRFFAPEIARRIVGSERQISAGEGQLREAAIFYCDIRGFTRLATGVDPNVLMCLLADYQALVVPIVHHHGGRVDKFLGDGIMATFGAAMANPTYAADAMRAVDEVLSAMDRWNSGQAAKAQPRLQIGASVATGSVIFGAVGNQTRLEYTVIGEAVNLCAKIEKHNKVERVHALTTRAAWDLALDQGYQPTGPGRPLKNRKIEGVEEPVDLVVPSGWDG